MVDYLRSRTVADRQIRKWGAPAVLRRAGVDRKCWALEVQLDANEKRALKNFNHRVFIISAVNLTVPPSKEDALVTYDVDEKGVNTATERPPLRQVSPVAPFAPGGYVIYWEIQVE